jgi:hypothetical protein
MQKQKSLPLPGIESVIQPVASHYTDMAILCVNAPKPGSRKPGYKLVESEILCLIFSVSKFTVSSIWHFVCKISIKIMVFWNVTLHRLCLDTSVSEESTVSVFRFVQNIGSYLPSYMDWRRV